MTNDELWSQAITIQRTVVERDGSAIDHLMNVRIHASLSEHELVRKNYNASHRRLDAMITASGAGEDYLLWKLSYDQ